MILYHGSNMFIEQVELQKCRPFKDFGRGFYCTEFIFGCALQAWRVPLQKPQNPYLNEN